jgi:predicted NBD/HSP70 family sugar kinase
MSSPYFIGIDIGGTKMAVSIFEVTSASVERVERFASGADCKPDEMVSQLVAVAQDWIAEKDRAPEAVGGFRGGRFTMGRVVA